MNRLITILLLATGINHVYGLSYGEAEMYADFGVAMTGAEATSKAKPGQDDLSGDDTEIGDIVTAPGIQLGLPNEVYREVEGMNTSGLGTSQDAANIISKLQDSLDASTDKNDLMHWYVTKGATNVTCSGHSFRCDFDSKAGTSVVMGIWLPQDASTINLSFTSHSKHLCISLWTYTIPDDGSEPFMIGHNEDNNNFSNPGAPDTAVTYTRTYETPHNVYGGGTYLFVMFNSNNAEKNFIDINGLGVTFTPEDPTETPEENPYNPAIGSNIVDDGSVPEPTTATLSLLALAGLAARRRRK